MRSKAKRKPGMQPIKRYEHGGPHDIFGNPIPPASVADTARLVNAGQAQMQELLDQGYLPYSDEPVLDQEIRREFAKADRGFFASNSIDLDEIQDAMLEKPWLARKMVPPGYTGFNESKLGYTNEFFKEYAKKVRDFVSENRGAYGGEYEFGTLFDSLADFEADPDQGGFARVREYLGDFVNLKQQFPGRNNSELVTESMKSAVEDVNSYNERLQELNSIQDFHKETLVPGQERSLESLYGTPIPASKAQGFGPYQGDDDQFFMDLVSYNNPNQFYASLVTADPGSLDFDEIKDLYTRGYGLGSMGSFEDSAFYGTGASLLDNVSAGITNFGIGLGNLFETRPGVEVVDRGDLGREVVRTPGTMREYVRPTGTKVTKFDNIYPTDALYTRVSKVHFDPITDQRELLPGRFYLDREAAGTGAVRRDDLVKTLFHRDIVPNRKLQFYNEELDDIVEIYTYDSPEMLKAAGLEKSLFDIEKDGDTSTSQETRQETTESSGTLPERRRSQNIKPLKAKSAGMNVVKNRDLKPMSPIQLPTGRVPIQIGALAQSQRGARQGGQKLDREYYWDPVKRQYREREVDSERVGGPVYGTTKLFDQKQTPGNPVYGGSYEFSKGGRLIKRVRS
tara:strand:+ start:7226 stop:9094 length:1869 start_codon:yes stop_codon:yes gene_type:complete